MKSWISQASAYHSYPCLLPPTQASSVAKQKQASVFDSEGVATKVTKTGYHGHLGGGKVNMTVKATNRIIGEIHSAATIIKSELLDLSVAPEIAKKFSSPETAKKYLHLDINMQAMRPGVKAGLFAEIYGLIPMTSGTATMIRTVSRQ